MSGPAPNAARTTAILLAGGSGARMQGKVEDKILHALAGKPVWRYSYDAFLESGCIQNIIFVCRDTAQQSQIKAGSDGPAVHFTIGGSQRQDSVWAGLQATPPETEIVLVHDCARPLIAPSAIVSAVEAAQHYGAASLARPATDTIKRAAPKPSGAYRVQTVDRSTLWAVETPQVFSYPLIKDAYQKVIDSGAVITDDLSALESIEHSIAFIKNPTANLKITTPQDLALAEFLLSRRTTP